MISNIISILIEQLEKPELSLWAQLSLENIGEKCIKYIEIEFSKRKENLLIRRIMLLLPHYAKLETKQGIQNLI